MVISIYKYILLSTKYILYYLNVTGGNIVHLFTKEETETQRN